MNIQILGLGKYLPTEKIENSFFASHFGLSEDDIFRQSGVRTRHRADRTSGETTVKMGAIAIENACASAGVALDELDLIVNVSAIPEQAIPDTSVLMQKELGLGNSGISCLSIHATCLGALRGLEVVAGLFQLGQYRRAVIVSSEISSIGLNPADPHTYPLFGDGAVAMIVEPSTESYVEKILFRSFGDYASSTMVRGGGTSIAPQNASIADYYFEMKGSQVLRQSLRKGGAFIQEMLGTERTIEAVDWIVPHQPSGIGLRAMERFFAKEKLLVSLEEYGNCISASMLLSLEKGVSSGQIRRGDRLLLIGTGAGLSLGAALLVY